MSTRRALYFASIARARGETADRMIDAEPSWVLPAGSDSTSPDGCLGRAVRRLIRDV